MQRFSHFLLEITMTVILIFSSSTASAASEYVSIRDLCKITPARWCGNYVISKGDKKNIKTGASVSIDAPVIVPKVDKVPVVRITWEPPGMQVDESLNVDLDVWAAKGIGRDFPTDEAGFTALDNKITFDPDLPWEDAPSIAVEEFKKWMPFMRNKELTCYDQRSYGVSDENGFQCLHFYTTYHGIPHLIGSTYFAKEIKSEYGPKRKEMGNPPAVPFTIVAMRIKRPGQFWANIYTSKEVAIDIEDIPLLPFNEILNLLEQRVKDGYVYSLNEVRFGYMGFIDPEKKGEEFVLLPIWAAKGRTRASLDFPFDLKTSQAVKDRIGYTSRDVIVINAQTGQIYDFENDIRPNRSHVPHIITWDEVN